MTGFWRSNDWNKAWWLLDGWITNHEITCKAHYSNIAYYASCRFWVSKAILKSRRKRAACNCACGTPQIGFFSLFLFASERCFIRTQIWDKKKDDVSFVSFHPETYWITRHKFFFLRCGGTWLIQIAKESWLRSFLTMIELSGFINKVQYMRALNWISPFHGAIINPNLSLRHQKGFTYARSRYWCTL